MDTQNPMVHFDKNTATSYDKERERLAPLKDALHLFMRFILSDLPTDATILCVGVGTGAELFYLAQVFPQWQFTAVEPASAMLNVCRQGADELGIASRCTFFEGQLESLPDSDGFDAATSILVSHFVGEPANRIKYYSEIASRLLPDAYLINADIAFQNITSNEFNRILPVWKTMHEYAGMPVNVDGFVKKGIVLPTEKVASILEGAGFDTPVLFFQTLLIHAWFSKVKLEK